jgi:hypothetical protein
MSDVRTLSCGAATVVADLGKRQASNCDVANASGLDSLESLSQQGGSNRTGRCTTIGLRLGSDIIARATQTALFGKRRLARPPRPDLRVKGVARTSDRNEFGASIGRRHRLARMQPGGRV